MATYTYFGDFDVTGASIAIPALGASLVGQLTVPLYAAALLNFSATPFAGTPAYTGAVPRSFAFLTEAATGTNVVAGDKSASTVMQAIFAEFAVLGSLTNVSVVGNNLVIDYTDQAPILVTSSGAATNFTLPTGKITLSFDSSTVFAAPPAPAPTGTSTARSTTIRYKKVVCWGLSPQAVSFAQSGSMGHRVSIVIPVDLMNKFFIWTRASGEVAPTGRFVNAPNATDEFTAELVKGLNGVYTDLDGVANGLNFSSSALDIAGDIKRDSNLTPSAAGTRYSANDLVMAYLMYKCFGSSSYDPTDIIYNVDDAFNMLNSQQLANLITASLESEDALANAAVLPNGKNVNQQLPGDNKGQVDAMFRGFLAADPIRYFLDGKQIPGLFETNFGASASDPSVNGNWCLTVGDKIEVPLKLVFRAPVSVLSVQDNVQNPSSATPDSVQTTMIAGEVPTFDCTSQRASPANELPIRLQITCGTPVGTAGTGSTSAPGTNVPLSIAASSSVIFYTPANYGAQSAIPVVAAGGTGALTYSMVRPTGLSTDVTINSATGVLSFNAATAATVTQWGKWVVPITVTDSAGTPVIVTKYVNVSLDDGNGSSNNSLWISAESLFIGDKATLAPYSASSVVKHGQVLQYAHAPYGKDGTADLLVNEVLSKDTLTFTYTPPTTGDLGANLPATEADEAEWKITSQSGKSGSAALPFGVVFTPAAAATALTATLDLDFETPPASGVVRAATGLYSFLVTAKDNNGYVQTFPVTINIVNPPVTNAAAPLAAVGSSLAPADVVNGSILRFAGATTTETIDLTATGALEPCVWSLSNVFGNAAGVVFGGSVVATNDIVITRGAHPAGTSCILVTCLDANNVSHTIFYTVVLE